MRIPAIALGILSLAAILCGCASAKNARYNPSWSQYGYSSALLFSRDPAVGPAGSYAIRSQWPGQTDWGRPGEAVYYRERFIDWQGPGHGTRDHTYRRFETVREGYRYR